MNYSLFLANLRTAWRSIVWMRTYSLINVVGLVVSLTGAIIIARYVHQEQTVDHYVPHLERTFLLTNVNNNGVEHSDAINHNNRDYWQDPMADPAVECFTRFTCVYGGLGVKTDDRMYKARTIAADSMFLHILSRDILAGTAEMKNPTDAIVTKDFADRLWPGEHPIGKTLEHDGHVLSVVGMVGTASTKCNFDYELLVNAELKMFMYMGWSLIRLKEGEDWTAYNKRQKSFTEDFGDGMSSDYHFQLFPFAKAYFDAPLEDYYQGGDRYFVQGDRQSMNYLIAGAMMLFAVGLFNFINIFAIVMQRRRKGMAVRKVFGATTAMLFGQIYIENVLIALIAVVLSWGIIAVASPAMEYYYNLSQQPSPGFDILLSLAIVLLFPLVITAALGPSKSPLKGDFISSPFKGDKRGYGLLFQYVITFFMLVVSSYSIHQLHYLLTTNMGYRTEDIIWFDLLPESHNPNAGGMTLEEYKERMRKDGQFREQAAEALRRVKESPLIVKACFHRNERVSLTGGKSTVEDWGVRAKRAGEDDGNFRNLANLYIEAEALDIYGLKLLEGDQPDAERDNYNTYRIFLSRSAKKALGIENIASEQVQFEKRLWWGLDENGNYQTDNPPYTIVGVYDDFSLTHLASQDMPFFIEIARAEIYYDQFTYFLAHYQHGKRRETLAFLQGIFEELNGAGNVMPYKLIEDEIAEIYADDARTARIYITFALLAIMVSCMGLFGISLYDVQRRRREIAIRRVHGAKVKDIFRLISRRYLVALGIAVAAGTPMALYALHYYIMGYAHHVPLTPLYFLGAALLMLLLTLATIWWQVRRATREAPSKVIKSE